MNCRYSDHLGTKTHFRLTKFEDLYLVQEHEELPINAWNTLPELKPWFHRAVNVRCCFQLCLVLLPGLLTFALTSFSHSHFSLLFIPCPSTSSPEIPKCLLSSRENLPRILFVACKLTWFQQASLSQPSLGGFLTFSFFSSFLVSLFWFCLCFHLC